MYVPIVCPTFYSSRPGSYNKIQGSIGGLVAGKILCSRALVTRSSKWCLQQCGHTWSCHLSCCTWSAVWRNAVESFGTVAAPGEWSIVLLLHCSCTIATCLHALQALTVLPARTSCMTMVALTSSALETCAHALGTCVPSCIGSLARLFFYAWGPWPIRSRGTHDSVRVHLSWKVRSEAIGHIATLEPTSAGRWGPEP
jgi:hypothetical protein